MSNAQAIRTRPLARAWSWLPATVDRRVRVVAWASLACQLLLIGTGGAVRLTGSGLGCPTWPQCVEGSYVSTPEMGLHGVIEFGNRLLTFVLVIVAVAAFLAVVRQRRVRRDLFVLALVQGLSIPLQAVIGGVTVLVGLNPWIVGLHFVVSIALVALMTVFVVRVLRGPRGRGLLAPRWYVRLAHVTSAVVAVVVLVGVVTTGAGPHAGDAATPRNGLDAALLEHLHAWPAYALFALTVVLVTVAWRRGLPRRAVTGLLAVELVQIAVGLTQARTGLPPVLVGTHMVLAGVLVAVTTATVLSLRADQTPDEVAAELPGVEAEDVLA